MHRTAPFCLSLALATSLVWLAARDGQAGPAPADPHRLWAYPKGVIVTSDGGKVNVTTPADETDKGKTKTGKGERDAAAGELSALGRVLEAGLTNCLATLRATTPELAKTGAKYTFSFEFTITADGSADGLAVVNQLDSAALPACAETARRQLAAHRFTPPALVAPLEARLAFDGLILTDEAAKGRGYEYYEAETAWEQTKRTHRAWFACRQDTDCVVATDPCEARGVNATYLDAYRQATAARKKPGCRGDVDPSDYKATCRHGRCTARRAGR